MIEDVKEIFNKVRQTIHYTMSVLNTKIHLIMFSPIRSKMIFKTVCFHLT